MNPIFRAALPALFSLNCLATEISASLDRDQVSEGETVELTLHSSNATQKGMPDLAPLSQDFEVLGSRQLSSLSTGAGGTRQATRWIISLRPLRLGTLSIPPLRVGDSRSPALQLQVSEASQALNGQAAPVFIDASLSQESVYVQAQVILTLRIYHSVSLYDDSSLTPLQMNDARVESLGEPKTFEQTINGVRHGVIELRYAIYPQRSGELSIPSQLFSATLVDNRQADELMPFGSRPGKQARVKSPVIPLLVKPRPAEFPTDAPWLPAAAVSLSEAWSPEPQKAMEGVSLTRNILLKADGLAGSQLPPLEQLEVSGLRRYPEQPKTANQADERGLLGSREESVALVPTRSGEVVLPALEVPWWNTRTDSLEYARLPERRLQVAINPQLQAETLPLTPASVSQSPQRLWPWQVASGVLALTNVLGFALWWRARKQPAVTATAGTGPSPRTLLDDLKRACQANDSQATRQALDAWARQHPETLAEMAARFAPLSEALDGLNGALYSESGQNWQGEALWKAVKGLPPLSTEATLAEHSLPPLYPR